MNRQDASTISYLLERKRLALKNLLSWSIFPIKIFYCNLIVHSAHQHVGLTQHNIHVAAKYMEFPLTYTVFCLTKEVYFIV